MKIEEFNRQCYEYFHPFEKNGITLKSSFITISFLTIFIPLSIGLAYGAGLLIERFQKGPPSNERRDIARTAQQILSPSNFQPFSAKLNALIRSRQIMVLSQIGNGGEHQCGYHAFKNALVGLGLAYSKKETTPEQFEDRAFYQNIFRVVSTHTTQNQDDVSIITLANALSELAKTPEWNFISSHVSMFNSDSDSPLNIGDATVLQSVSNLIRLKADPKPGVHAFLMGFDGHWITLFYERDRAGNTRWYGTDSWNNDSSRFDSAIKQLENLMNRLEEEAPRIYEYVVGGTLARRAGYFNEKGELKDESNRAILVDGRKQNELRLDHAMKFIKEAGWERNTDSAMQTYIKNINILNKFYNRSLLV